MSPQNDKHLLLRMKSVENRTGLKCSQIYARIKEHNFPAFIKIGPASVARLEQEMNELRKKINQR